MWSIFKILCFYGNYLYQQDSRATAWGQVGWSRETSVKRQALSHLEIDFKAYTADLERYWPFYDMVRVWNYNTYTQFPHSLCESKWYWDKSNLKISFQSALKIHKHQFSRWAPVLWPKSSKTLFGPVIISVFI